MKSLKQAIKESTCQKRITICEIYDATGKLLARESNRCSPIGGTCHRLGVVQSKSNYDVESHCNWTHAEINAVNSLKHDDKPYRAVLYGHDFYCNHCEQALRKVGCKKFQISNLKLNTMKQNKGFAAMPKDQVKQISSMGGKSHTREHMKEIGRKGGIASGLARANKKGMDVCQAVKEQISKATHNVD